MIKFSFFPSCTKLHCVAGSGLATHHVYNPLTDSFEAAAVSAPFIGVGVPFTYQGKHFLVQGTDFYEMTTANDGTSVTWSTVGTHDVNVGTDGGWSFVFEGYDPIGEAPEELADLNAYDLVPLNAMPLLELDWLSSYE